ncbi:MAG: ferritin-like domain-containing protein [Nocardioides sp.]
MSGLDALQQALAAEHAACYVYGVLGGLVSRSRTPTLADTVDHTYGDHGRRRDELEALVRTRGATPVPAAPAYDVPRALSTPTQLVEQALRVERACATSYAALVGSVTGGTRHWAVESLTRTAIRQVDFGAAPEAFPGAPELGG